MHFLRLKSFHPEHLRPCFIAPRRGLLLQISVWSLFLLQMTCGSKPAAPIGRLALGPVNASTASSAPSNLVSGVLVAKPITSIGENSEASFSRDGSKILFHSRLRPSHKQTQLYELQLGTMVERRITFQNGEVSGGDYYPDGEHIVYSSSTDELKEETVYLDNIMRSFYPEGLPPKGKGEKTAGVAESIRPPALPSDLYKQRIDGREIERLTESPGFDGDPALDSTGARIVFTSGRSGLLTIYLLSVRGLNRLTETDGPDRFAHFAPDDKALVWSHFAKEDSKSQIMLAEGNFKKPRPLTALDALDLYPVWNPNGQEIVFSSNRGGKGFDLYSIDLEGKCLKRITDFPGDELFPAFSPDGKKLLFTSSQSGLMQIYMMDYKAPATCP